MPNPTERPHQPDPRSQAGALRRTLHLLVAGAGWAAFAWAWVQILGRVRGPDVSLTLTFLALSVTIVASACWLWAAHNAHLSRTRRPRLKVRERVVRHTRHLESLTESAIVAIAVEDGRKVYHAEPAEAPAMPLREAA